VFLSESENRSHSFRRRSFIVGGFLYILLVCFFLVPSFFVPPPSFATKQHVFNILSDANFFSRTDRSFFPFPKDSATPLLVLMLLSPPFSACSCATCRPDLPEHGFVDFFRPFKSCLGWFLRSRTFYPLLADGHGLRAVADGFFQHFSRFLPV